LWLWQWQGLWRQQRGRAVIAITAIAIGVALGAAIHLVNASALDEFGRALAVVNGEAQWQVHPTGAAFDESLYARLAGDEGRRIGLSAVSPVIDLRVAVIGPSGRPADDQPLRLIGIDLYRAARVTPGLLPRVSAGDRDGGAASPLFGDDSIFVSATARRSLDLDEGSVLRLRGPHGPVTLRIRGDVGDAPNATASGATATPDVGPAIDAPGMTRGADRGEDRSPALAVMDIGALQWRLGWLGHLNRIDLRVRDGVSAETLARELGPLLGRQARLQAPEVSEQRMSNLSRAYRVNLGVLSLVALFTGAFIVYATLALAVTRQRASLAMLAVLGMTRRQVQALVLGQGLLLGAIGSAVGVLAGIALAHLFLSRVGGDLGGGYFGGSMPRLAWSGTALTGYWLAGVVAGGVGSWWPMRSLDRQPVVARLRGAEADAGTSPRHLAAWPLAWLAAGAVLLQCPPIGGLPVAAYAAIAAWLFAGIAAVPILVAALASSALRVPAMARAAPLWLACQRLGLARMSAVGTLSGVVASFALASAMAIMVTSFRGSVEQWLDRVLPADLYTRSPATGPAGPLDARIRSQLMAIPGVVRADLLRATELTLDPQRPPVALLARPIDAERPASSLPITGALAAAPAARPAARLDPSAAQPAAPDSPVPVSVYASEAAAELYGWRPGAEIELPLGTERPEGTEGPRRQAGQAGPAPGRFIVRGIWRDYARQFGAIAIDENDYVRLTGDRGKTDVAVWLAPSAAIDTTLADIRRAVPALADLPWRSAGEVRALSLRIFDRSFAVTYLLEAIALAVGLFGVAATFAGEAVARGREFGLLRQLGVTRRAIGGQLAIEAALLLCCGVLWGLLVGVAIAWVLIDWVNPQSFHWTMDMQLPTGILSASAIGLVLIGTATAAIASRQAAGQSPVRAVRADW